MQNNSWNFLARYSVDILIVCVIICLTHVTVNGEALQMHAVYKKPYFYYKLSNNLYQYYKLQENLYQVLQVMHAMSECAMIMS